MLVRGICVILLRIRFELLLQRFQVEKVSAKGTVESGLKTRPFRHFLEKLCETMFVRRREKAHQSLRFRIKGNDVRRFLRVTNLGGELAQRDVMLGANGGGTRMRIVTTR